jgi:hypothetical protein
MRKMCSEEQDLALMAGRRLVGEERNFNVTFPSLLWESSDVEIAEDSL